MPRSPNPAPAPGPETAPCPVDAVLPRLRAALEDAPHAVLCAPPGAGKTTRVPLALLTAPWLRGRRILMLEPRRLAARAAARYMARLLGEPVGRTVGYRVRLESCVGPETRIEVLTEGILTRYLQDDPELAGVGCVIFDEFHERSLHADTGLALCLDSREALRPDLRLVIMSATLDAEPVAHLLGGDCPVIRSEGRSRPVEIRHAPPPAPLRMENHAAAVIRHALAREQGGILAFLPGAAEIRRVAELLGPSPAPGVTVHPLYGDLPPEEQDAALLPAVPPARKVVLATSIAETSLTIEGIRVVVDAGLTRTVRVDPATDMGRLVTERVSLAGADQRAGRAGRTEPGVCYRLWRAGEEAGLRPFARPEMPDADLAPLLLQLALWGVSDPATLRWLDAPPQAAVERARQTLHALDALRPARGQGTDAVVLTPHGRALAALPLHPRLANMVLRGKEDGSGSLACCLAALQEERDPLRRADSDIRRRVEHLCAARTTTPPPRRLRESARQTARLAGIAFSFAEAAADVDATGRLLALARPEWLAKQRDGSPGRFLLRNGRAAVLPPEDPLAHAPFLAVAALDGDPARARIHLAAPLNRQDVEELFAAHIRTEDVLCWDPDAEAVIARRRVRLDALVLEESPPAVPPSPDAVTPAVLEGIRLLGLSCLPWTEELRQWQARVTLLRALEGKVWPDVTDAALSDTLETWLAPFLTGIARRAQFRAVDLKGALRALLPWELAQRLERDAPTHLDVPSGSRLRLDYRPEGGPVLAVKLQEMFGCVTTPCVAGGKAPVCLHLTSPAGRPLQVTRDLAGFWRTGYPAVRAEMRGRYPKHPWPKDPLTAPPTRKTSRALRQQP